MFHLKREEVSLSKYSDLLTYTAMLTYSQQCFMMTVLTSYCVHGYFFCFNGFNRFTCFNMGRITNNDRCLIKAIKTEIINIAAAAAATSTTINTLLTM